VTAPEHRPFVQEVGPDPVVNKRLDSYASPAQLALADWYQAKASYPTPPRREALANAYGILQALEEAGFEVVPKREPPP
jgi:hypothetical protein